MLVVVLVEIGMRGEAADAVVVEDRVADHGDDIFLQQHAARLGNAVVLGDERCFNEVCVRDAAAASGLIADDLASDNFPGVIHPHRCRCVRGCRSRSSPTATGFRRWPRRSAAPSWIQSSCLGCSPVPEWPPPACTSLSMKSHPRNQTLALSSRSDERATAPPDPPVLFR